MRPLFLSLAIAATAVTMAPAALAKTADAGSNDQVVLTKSGDKYCAAAAPVTGSILPQKICKTRADWIAAGAKVEKKQS